MVPLRHAVGALLASAVLLAACNADTPPVEVSNPPATEAPTTTPSTSDAATVDPTATADPTVSPQPTAAPEPPPEFVAEPVDWASCDANLECGQLTVPIDYADPDAGTIELDVIRQPAGDPTARIGSIVVNPGGPGGSGVNFVRGGVPLAASVTESFDVVGWDPRGVGATAPDCGDSLPEFYAADSDPTDAEGVERLASLATDVANECAAAEGDRLAAISTAATVRDLELLRQALDEPLNYLGFSYGSELGLLYADAFGDQIRSMALVGVVDPSLGFEGVLKGQAAAIDQAVTEMLASCPAVPQCDLDDPQAAYDEVAGRVREGEFAEAGLGPAQLVDATLGAVYSELRWGPYLVALEAALGGDPTPLLGEAADYYRGGDLFLSYTAITCLLEEPPQADDYRDFAAELDTLSPRFGAAIANELLPCAYWGVAHVDPAAPVVAAEAPTILLATSTRDAITPVEWTQSVADRLNEPIVILRDGSGHVGTASSPCVSDGIALYLFDPEAAPPLLECES